jgi:AcrR family transcriptional regulator
VRPCCCGVASATSIDRVLLHSGASRGSVYHYFPEGRSQLIGEAVDLAGEYIGRKFEAMPRPAIRCVRSTRSSNHWRVRLVENDFGSAARSSRWPWRRTTRPRSWPRSAAAVFGRWQDALTAMLVRGGLPEERGSAAGRDDHRGGRGSDHPVPRAAEHRSARRDAAEMHDLLVGALSG